MNTINNLSRAKVFLIFLCIGAIVYFNVFFNGFVGDDKEQIYNYGLVKGLIDLPNVFLYHHAVLNQEHAILGAYYKPLMLFYFYTIRSTFGIQPFFFHTPQVILAIINSFLVYLLLTRFFKKEISFFLSLLFLILPINQETVAYASNIQDVLFFFFGMLGLLLLFKTTHLKHIALSCAFLLCALLSKETGILFVVISLLSVFLFKKSFFKKYIFGFLFVLFVYFSLRLSSKSTSVFWIEPSSMSQVPFSERVKNIPLIFFYYIKTFLFPATLTFNQQWIIKRVDIQTFFAPLFFSILFLLSVGGWNFYTYKRGSKKYIPLFFFTCWFFIGLLPHLQLLPLDATVADRWFYFSSVGALGILGTVLEYFLLRFKKKEKIILSFLIVLCVILSMRTFVRNVEWRDAFTLYTHDANRANSALIENNLGDEYFKMGDTKNAQLHFKNAASLNPHLWIAINNMGILEEQKGNLDEAKQYYQKSLDEGDRLPTYENLARILVLEKKSKDAEVFIKNALKKYPLSAKLWLTLSLAQYDQNDYKNALVSSKKSYDLLPDLKTQNVISAIQKKLKTGN